MLLRGLPGMAISIRSFDNNGIRTLLLNLVLLLRPVMIMSSNIPDSSMQTFKTLICSAINSNLVPTLSLIWRYGCWPFQIDSKTNSHSYLFDLRFWQLQSVIEPPFAGCYFSPARWPHAAMHPFQYPSSFYGPIHKLPIYTYKGFNYVLFKYLLTVVNYRSQNASPKIRCMIKCDTKDWSKKVHVSL